MTSMVSPSGKSSSASGGDCLFVAETYVRKNGAVPSAVLFFSLSDACGAFHRWAASQSFDELVVLEGGMVLEFILFVLSSFWK